jgi:16S rRNA processing protein RimM
LPLLKKNEYYWYDLINYDVFNINCKYLGKVIDLIRTKNNDILIIKHESNKKNILIPFIDKTTIKKVDINKKIITVQ